MRIFMYAVMFLLGFATAAFFQAEAEEDIWMGLTDDEHHFNKEEDDE